MTRPDRSKTALRSILLVAAIAANTPQPAAASWLVFDSASNAKLMEQIQAAKNQLTELTEMKKLAEEQLSAIGGFGPMGEILGGMGLSSLGSKADFYDQMESFAWDPCAINLCTVGKNELGITDLGDAEAWAQRNFYTSKPLAAEESRDLAEVRRRAVVYTATRGVALANVVHNDLAGAGAEADALEQIVDASNDLRGDVRANSAIALATYKVEVQKLAMLTAMLGVESASAIASTGVYHELGGTRFPEAFIDSDFVGTDTSRRLKVTVPTKGAASGGGIGGGLFGALAGGSGSPLEMLAGAAGLDGGTASIFSSDDPIGSLLSGMANGTVPIVSGDDVSMETLLSDAVGVAGSVLRATGNDEAANMINSVGSAVASGINGDRTDLIFSVAGAVATSTGNGDVANIMSSANSLLKSRDKKGMLQFAKTVIEDGAGGTVDSDAFRILSRAVEKADAEGLTRAEAKALLLDASTVAVQRAGGGDARGVARILASDPSKLTTDNVKELTTYTMDTIARTSGNDDLRKISSSLKRIRSSDIDRLRTEISAQASDR